MQRRIMVPRYDIPFVPSSDDRVRVMLELARVKKGEEAVDLGAGDGKLVVALAKAGANVTGIEIDEGRAQLASVVADTRGLSNRVQIIQGSFWEHNLGRYHLIVLYGITGIMKRLQQKIIDEAPRDCRIVSNFFEFPDWTPLKSRNDVHLYKPFA